ncbi:GNAT family N-acetyltransferase [Guptibacillus sedimenti]|uniref:GNAT family N-acetyltransferase n=1 Tax=Guptibacillus sedimenti TaxID=3025680 RepID=UPI00235FE455|nr:GNAT family N-acetyltransferase [Pseudalkalibacillus sedimenti]
MNTVRCELRLFLETDKQHVKRLYKSEQVRKYLGGTVDDETFEQGFNSMINSQKTSSYWTVFLRNSKEFIGIVFLDTYRDGVKTEVGYQFLPEFWGHGYAGEVVTDVIEYGFNELNLDEIVAETQTQNTSSCRLLQKVGMTCVGQLERFGEEQSVFQLCRP